MLNQLEDNIESKIKGRTGAYFVGRVTWNKDRTLYFYVEDAEVVNEIKSFEIRTGDAFVVVDDRDLEFLVRYSIDHRLQPGTDMGIISYNETPLKGIVASGITTISTDFAQMGKTMAEMILNHLKLKLDNPFLMYRRESF